MSRPPISYPIQSRTSEYDDTASIRPQLEPSAFPREAASSAPRNASGHARGPASALDSYITRLLVVTKQLLQGLEQWCQGTLSEEDVSDIYVRLGNGFELCVTAFRKAGISTSDLDSVPRDLREILERALAEDPSQETLNLYLPDIRAIIFSLLSGLKNKQIAYKRLLTERQTPETPYAPLVGTPSRPPRGSESAADSARSITSDGPASPASSSSHLPIGPSRSQPTASALAERNQQRAPASRPAPPDAFRPPRSRTDNGSSSGNRPDLSTLQPPGSASSDKRPLPSQPSLQSTSAPSPTLQAPPHPPPRTHPHPDRFSHESQLRSRFSADSDMSVLTRTTSDGASLAKSPSTMSKESTASTGPPMLPTLNLPTNINLDEGGASARSSFAALQRSDALERRASKRFSSYTFNKMLPSSPTSKKVAQNGSPQRPARRSDRFPPMPALLEDANGVAVSPETHVNIGSPTPGSSAATETLPVTIPGSRSEPDLSPPSLDLARTASNEQGGQPVADAMAAEVSGGDTLKGAQAAALQQLQAGAVTTLKIYLQLGRQVKKTPVELPLTMSALRLLFMERFEYDPGMEDFPDVYIRDPRTGVQYELEDMDDVKEGCVLTLDIEPLDQVKQHFDITFASLAQDIKELKQSLNQSKRVSTQIPSHPSLLTVSSPQPARTIEKSPELPPQVTPRAPPTATFGPPHPDLQTHYQEVQDLRRDLAVMRQLHLDFLSQTKESFGQLRAQNLAMREVVKTKMGGNRALLDNSKSKLEQQCQDTIQSVEEVSDIIDGSREDALRRGIIPSSSKMEKVRADLESAAKLVDTFAHDVTLAEPTWRATWLSELQRVTEEQRLLAYQNKLAADLKNDIKDATEMLDNVQAFVVNKQTSGGRKFRPPSPETTNPSGGIGNLLLEIRTKETNPNARLKAIEEQQRVRERELANKTDEFTNELSGFVAGKKLRKTGGTEETERVRARRSEKTLKRMLTAEGDVESPPLSALTPQLTGGTRIASDGARSRNSTSSTAETTEK
ncbi:Bud site selection protein 6 [Vanrija albida]|uniref:Bud site selection protein 6 n=1 Tax=Vanrija albida TaxID=181172 RepID=A0ABR3QBL0_9TREE